MERAIEGGVEGGRDSEIYFVLTSYVYSLAILMVCCEGREGEGREEMYLIYFPETKNTNKTAFSRKKCQYFPFFKNFFGDY